MSPRRGSIVTVALQGEFGKPRPALVVQADWARATETIVIALITTDLQDASVYRHTIEPTAANGLRLPSQVQIDKVVAVPIRRIGQMVGSIEPSQMAEVSRLLAALIGIADD